MERLGKLDVRKTTMQERYSRHILLKEIGEKGQEKIKQAKVLVVGAGGLGSPILLYLAAAGIGTLGFTTYQKVTYNARSCMIPEA